MKTSMRNLLLNLLVIGLLALFLVWAETNLDGSPGSWPSGPRFPPCACSPPPRRK